MHSPRDVAITGLIVFASMSLIVLGDTAGKILAGDGVSPFFIAWSRFLVGALIIVPVLGLTRRKAAELISPGILLRSACIASAVCCILIALRTEPIANVFGAFFISPFVSYVLAICFLGERVSWIRIALLVVGFLGVLLVVQPGPGGGGGIHFAFLAGALHGAYLTLTRRFASRFDPQFLLVSQLVVGSVLLAPIGVQYVDFDFSTSIALLVVVSALASAVGNFLLAIAYKRSDAATVSPFVYTQLISAVLLGLLVFGDWPNALALIGLLTILLSGVATLFLRPAPAQEMRRGGSGRKL